jgi:mRNA deadenylase 3'-5' endonuclease subunit Ccr4
MINEMISSGADIICLQECEDGAFENEFQPQLNQAGYNGLLQVWQISNSLSTFILS